MVSSRALVSPFLLLIAVAGLLLAQGAAKPESQTDIAGSLSAGLHNLSLPLSFEANHGQTNESVAFVSRNAGFDVFAADAGPVISLPSAGVTIDLAGANPSPSIHGESQLPGIVNYFIGDDESKWLTGIPTYAGVVYEGVYPGVDLSLYGNQSGAMEYDFIVSPGADPSAIQLSFDGADGVALQADGSLLLSVGGDEIVQRPPVLYQETAGGRVPVDGHYVMNGGVVSFAVGEYDRTLPLVIDPVIVWARLLAGGDADSAHGVATDGDRDLYVTGETESANFPTTTGAFSETYMNLTDVFVTKINAEGTDILYSTFIGGNGSDVGWDIEVNNNGEAFVGGLASENFPGADQGGFILKLSDDGSALEYTAALGANTEVYGIEIDGEDNVYFAGSSLQAFFGATAGSFQPALNGNGDGIVGELANDGSALVWGSYIGGEDREFAYDVARDPDGYVYITGVTPSDDFPVVNAEDTSLAAVRDAFVAKIMPDGSALMYSTYLGGDGSGLSDQGYGITADANGNAYVTGYTNSSMTFPITNGAFQPNYGGNQDAFVTKYDADGDLVYSTFLGGNNVDNGAGIELDDDGNIYVAGETSSSDFPTANPVDGDADSTDAFVSELNAAGSSLIFSTYLSGDGQDNININGGALSVGEDGTIYVVGSTDSSNFPVTAGALTASIGVQGGQIGNDDAFVVVIGNGQIGGDVDCSGSANPIDSLKILRADAGLGNPSVPGCPDIGDEALINGVLRIWGDMNCSGSVDPVDSLVLLRYDAGLSINIPADCPELGEIHQVKLV
jgi:hypothetical protein